MDGAEMETVVRLSAAECDRFLELIDDSEPGPALRAAAAAYWADVAYGRIISLD